MFLDINYFNLAYTSIFLIMLMLSYFVIIFSRFEQCFKKGNVVAIRIAQVLLAIIIAYLVTKGIMSLVEYSQF